ncbi:MAG: L-threonylcarbamoyladenylate synthase [Candidatus Nanoarchaeia archaeon]
MKTEIFSEKEIKKAAELIKKGELIAFPTETVYGLGANALDPKAVKKIFKAKGRPCDNPLIVHIANKKQVFELAEVNEKQKVLVKKLTKKFWPGPLTIVLKKKRIIPKEVTGGLDTVAVRMPKNKIALKLIKYAGVPIAAPSANISGKPSGTSFQHVLDDFNGKIAGVIKSKDCKIGVESTVLDLTAKIPLILRPGGTSLEKLRKILGDVELAKHKNVKRPKSPGMKYRHYSPDAKVILFEKSAYKKIEFYKIKLEKKGMKVKVIYPEKIKNFSKKLFKIFRDCDKNGFDYILILSPKTKGIGLALRNRIEKAASKIVR